MTTATVSLEVIDETTDDTTPYCEACGENLPNGDNGIENEAGERLCRECHGQAQLDEAEDAVQVAVGEVESIEQELIDRKAEYLEALRELKEQYESDCEDIKDRLKEERKTLEAAKTKLAKLS